MGTGILKILLTGLFLVVTSQAIWAQNTVVLTIKHLANAGVRSQAESTANRVLNEINLAYWDGRVPNLNSLGLRDSALSNVWAIWANQPFSCPEPQLFLPAIRRPGGQFEVRGVPLRLGKKDEPSATFEEGILVFSATGDLENLYLGLPEHQYKQVMAGVDVQDLKRRQIILDFVENFRTAYTRKDLAFLEKVFSDNALIIVGKVIQEQRTDPEFMQRSLGEQRVELIRMSKRQYLDGLRGVFKRNASIKVGFDNIEIVQHKQKPDFYGVNLTQSWAATGGYSDQGYLFLLIDFRKEQEPMVWVRAWQPTEFTKKDEVLSLDQFILQ